MTPTATPATIRVPLGGDELDVWHFAAAHDELGSPAGRPAVVMAHGLAGTKDSGLAPFAEALAGAGFEVFALDYRGFGASSGTPRQQVRVARQLDDFRAVVAHARALDAVDAARVAVWGVSLAGGHVLTLAATDPRIAAVVSLTPLVDGLAAGRHAMAHHRPTAMLRSSALGVASKVAAARGRPARTMPVVARPGELGALTLDGCLEDYTALAGPTWRNEVDAAVGLELGSVRAGRDAKAVTCPTLVQIGDLDRSAPPHAAGKAAFAARAIVHHYPCDHFDVWPGKAWHDAAVRHQVAFLTRVLAPAVVSR